MTLTKSQTLKSHKNTHSGGALFNVIYDSRILPVWQLVDTYANPLWPEASFMCTMFQAPNSSQLTTKNYSLFFPCNQFFDMLSDLYV
jgi:hypothetical protein